MTLPRRLIHNEFDLSDIAESQDRPIELIGQDFALVTVAAHLASDFPGQLIFKGGFVFRHVYGHARFSDDIDATRTEPPKHKFDSAEIADSIRRASDEPLLRIDPQAPQTDSARGLDFDAVKFRTPTHGGVIAVEISYREAVIDPPCITPIGPPYYEEFEIPVLTPQEGIAEKLRTLIQRRRATDLADMAMRLSGPGLDEKRIRELAAKKFELVKQGDFLGRIQRNIESLQGDYESTVPNLAPDAPPYSEAKQIVLDALPQIVP